MTSDADLRTTLIRADGETPGAGGRSGAGTLPSDLRVQAVGRLRAAALLYALAFFLAGPLGSLLTPARRTTYLAEPGSWVPAALSIAGALLIAWLVSLERLSPRAKVRAGLAFEVLGSFGIAFAQYHDIAAPISYAGVGPWDFGLSWVAPFVLLFSVVVPVPPRTALLAAAGGVSAVPVVYAMQASLGVNVPLPPFQFFLALVFPYLVVLVMVYVGARIVFGLGTAVREARELGSYRLVARLGEGGMGEVWRAQHRMLARPAAIKLIRPEVLGATEPESRRLLLRRFEREAQATALMRSVHTVELHDFGVAENGAFYYAMELLDGFDLDDLVQRFGPVPPERAVHFLRQICDSLAEAHDAGLIHRDVKPANVYACRYGREVDFIKVLDFGLVKHGHTADDGADTLTGGRIAGGTPAFMSPEQALGEPLDGRSDLYSLGCVAYWLLTGTLVFKGGTTMETLVMHVSREPEPPSRRIESPIPADLEAIVLACLDKDPDARPRNADELADRLAAVRLTREWTARRARKWWDRNRPADGALVRAATGLVAAGEPGAAP